MGNRGDHLGVGKEHQRYEREERESIEKLQEVMREDEVVEARKWAKRLATGATLRDQSRSIILHHVGRLADWVEFLERENAALRKNATEREACLTRRIKDVKSQLSKSRDNVRNLLRYRTDSQLTA